MSLQNPSTQQNHQQVQKRFIREAECFHITGISRTTRWRLEQTGDFPKRRRLGPCMVGWLESELEAWIDARSSL